MIPRRRDPIGLYLHIPFCDGKCPYCDFYSLPADVYKRQDQAAVKHKAIGEQQIDRLQAGKNLLEMLDQIRQNGNKI